MCRDPSYVKLATNLCAWKAFNTLMRGTQSHICIGKLCYIGKIFNCSQEITLHMVASLDQVLKCWRAKDSSAGPVSRSEYCCGSIWLQDIDECQETEAHQPSGRLETMMGEYHRSVPCLQACSLRCSEWQWSICEILTKGTEACAGE